MLTRGVIEGWRSQAKQQAKHFARFGTIGKNNGEEERQKNERRASRV